MSDTSVSASASVHAFMACRAPAATTVTICTSDSEAALQVACQIVYSLVCCDAESRHALPVSTFEGSEVLSHTLRMADTPVDEVRPGKVRVEVTCT